MTYPNDSLQYNIDDTWWEEDKSVEPKRGSLLWVYCCAIEPKPAILTPTSRSTPTNHTIAQAEIKTINSFEDIKNQTKLPIAGLPIRDKEFYFVFRAKMRPALVLSEPNQKLENIPGDTSKYIKQRTLLVAPYYGTEQNGARAGWPPPLVQRIKNCVYPQFMWEILPAKKSPSILRLDHIQHIGLDKSNYDRYNINKMAFKLSEKALHVLDSQLNWMLNNILHEDDLQCLLREVYPHT